MKIKLFVLCFLFLLIFTGCDKQNKDLPQVIMSIKPSEFSKETVDILKLFDNEIQFFDVQFNDTAKSYSITLWEYYDGEWHGDTESRGSIENVGNRIAIRLTENTYEFIHIDDRGHTKITSPSLQTDFTNTSAKIQWKVSQEETLELDKEKVIFAKVGTNNTVFSSSKLSENFKEIECEAGIAITLTVYGEELK